MKHYDLVIIGGGGGLKLVGPARKAGKHVAVIEAQALGGTCLNRGCIPSKMLIYPAEVAEHIKQASTYHLSALWQGAEFSALTREIKDTIEQDSHAVREKYLNDPGIDLYEEWTSFIDEQTLQVGNEHITGDHIIIATGSRPKIPPIPGLDETPYMTSTDALYREDLPQRLIVIGGGYIGVELGHAYHALGSEVHFLVRNRMIAFEDEEVIDAFEAYFKKDHHVHQNINITGTSYDEHSGEITVSYSDQEGNTHHIQGDALLIATGIQPNTDTLGLENTSIATDKQGHINVNAYLETQNPGIYAIGDCIGHYFFRHSVNFEGEYLANRLLEGADHPISYPPMPHAIFTEPQIAGVGQTEQALKQAGTPYVVGKNYLEDSAYGMALRTHTGFVKLLFHQEDKRLLGAHIIGYQASVMIHQLIAMMTMQATLDNLLNMIYVHPALPENVRNAARDADRKFRHMK